MCVFFFFFNDTATTEIYTLSYTTLFRSLKHFTGGLSEKTRWVWRCHIDTSTPNRQVMDYLLPYVADYDAQIYTRSEEHTSELQSRQYLVCRLLLEKKKHSSLHTADKDKL